MKKSFFLLMFMLIAAGALWSQVQKDTIRYQLQPVTITATRVSEGWLEVPLAINVLEHNDIQHTKGYGLDEILSGVPGVLAQSRYGNQDIRLTIRGFGARGAGAKSNAGTSRGIRVLIDGFPETEPDGRTSFDLIDLSGAGSVEVVRSNASSVWGNASGGVVNILSNTTFTAPYSHLQSMFGSFGFHKEMLHGGAMLGQGRFFFSASNTTYDGWRDHSASSQILVNTGVISPLAEKTSLGVYLTGTSNLFRIPGPLSQGQFDSNPQQAQNLKDSVTGVNYTLVARDERRFNRLGRLGVNLMHDIDPKNSFSASAFVSPKYLQRSERNRFRDFNRYHVGGNFTYSNRASFSPEVSNTLLVGVDEAYQDGAIHFYNLTSAGDRGTILAANKREGANNFGTFLEDEIMLSDRVSILAGVRYDNITYYYDDYITPSLNDRKSFEHLTPKAGFTYKLSPTHSVYANIGGGVEVPAGNEVDPSPTFGQDTVRAINPLLDPITSTTLELGTKQVLSLGGDERVGAILYDIALYWIEVSNDIIPYDDGSFYFTAGKTRRMGAEIGGRLQFENGFSVEGTLTTSDNKYITYQIDSVHYGVAGKFRDLKDNLMSGVPSFFFDAGVRYSPLGMEGVYAKVNLRGAGKYFADDGNQFEVPAYSVLNASIGIDHLPIENTGFTLTGFIGANNLADKKYAAAAWINPQLIYGKPVFLEPGLPRNFVGSFSVQYDF